MSEESGEYEVERIVNHRRKNGVLEYRLKWKGYPMSECTWEDEDQLSCDDLLKEYWEQKKIADENKLRKEKLTKPKLHHITVRRKSESNSTAINDGRTFKFEKNADNEEKKINSDHVLKHNKDDKPKKSVTGEDSLLPEASPPKNKHLGQDNGRQTNELSDENQHKNPISTENVNNIQQINDNNIVSTKLENDVPLEKKEVETKLSKNETKNDEIKHTSQIPFPEVDRSVSSNHMSSNQKHVDGLQKIQIIAASKDNDTGQIMFLVQLKKKPSQKMILSNEYVKRNYTKTLLSFYLNNIKMIAPVESFSS